MRRTLIGLVVVGVALLLVACGGDSGDDRGDRDGGANGGSGDGQTGQSVDSDDLSYLTLTPDGLVRIHAESGDDDVLASAADLGLTPSESLQLARLVDGLLWGAVGPGHLIAIDPRSGNVEQDLTFGSTQTISDFGFAAGLLWVQAGFAFSDALLLGVDRNSGDLVFNIEPPAGASLGGLAAGDEGVWVIGGDPESASAVSRVDTGSGTVSGTFEVGLVAKLIEVGSGGVWVGGNQFAFEGKDGDAVARIDPDSGEIVATIEIGDTLRSILATNGAIWVVDASGPDFSGAQLHRIDPATNEITDTVAVGAAGTGGLDLITGGGYIFAINSSDRMTYVINADTAEGEFILEGPFRPVAVQ